MAVDPIIMTCGVVLFSLYLRISTSMNSYSGANTPPMFGDYEAQRHWMEITHHLPPDEWYVQTKENDLLYWGLDYPPLTAYHSKLCGYLANLINPDWVALNQSRGYESYHHKLFMRYSVIAADLIIYIPAVIWFFYNALRKETPIKKASVIGVVLSFPGLILIDHGHFQYNCVSLGFTILSIIFLFKNQHATGSMFFALALNYKQMELYHALPFFFYLLGISWKQKSWMSSFFKLFTIGFAVIVTFFLCWLPFLGSIDSVLAVIQRLFPFNRGLFEDKVANFWCTVSVVFKLKSILQQQQIVLLCLITTLLSCIPSSINLLLYPTKKKFLYSLVNCSLCFFLFSYQVHEKSILIVALPVCLLICDAPIISTWFLMIATISMYPLLVRDGQSSSYFALLVMFFVLCIYVFDFNKKCSTVTKQMIGISLCTALLIHILYVAVKPPEKFPDLYPLLFSVYSCCHFVVFAMYFNFEQFTCSHNESSFESLYDIRKEKEN